jgi:hypothetical protein
MNTIGFKFTFIGGCGLLLLSGCASVVCGPKQDIAINSSPRSAEVLVYDSSCEVIYSNMTPCTATLKRSAGDSKSGCYVVLIKKDGYAPVEVPLAGRVNGAYYWNFLNAGIGYLVDPATGSMWTLGPKTADGMQVKDKADFFTQAGLFISLKENTSPNETARKSLPAEGFTQISLGH